MTMQALRQLAWGAEPQLVELPVPEPGAGQLLLRVEAAGLCHSDLHVMDSAGTLPYDLPFTLGHEVAGTVVALGRGVSEQWLGELVAVHGVWSCGECRRCRAGRENYCLRLTGPVGAGLGYDGGLAEYVLVPSERFLVRGHGVKPEQLAPLTDAGLTAYHAVHQNREAIAGGGTAVVVGVGGLGHLAVQVLRALPEVEVVAVDPRGPARKLAEELGADVVLAGLDELGRDADLVLDFVGSDASLAQGAPLVAMGGRLVVVGSGGGSLAASKHGSLSRGWQVSAPFWGPRADLEAVVGLASQGALVVETETSSLAEAPELYRRLRRGDVRGRAVVVPH